MAKNKKQMKQPEPSLRDKIKIYRRGLHGDVAAAFDAAFVASAGFGKSLKEALQEGQNLQKAFVTAKNAIGNPNPKIINDDNDDS